MVNLQLEINKKWDLHLFDIQTYTKLILNTSKYGNETIPSSSFIEGKNSGATGFTVAGINNTDTIQLRQTSGKFISGESLIVEWCRFINWCGHCNCF